MQEIIRNKEASLLTIKVDTAAVWEESVSITSSKRVGVYREAY